MTTRNEVKKTDAIFFSLVGLKRSACTWCWCIYVIWSCVRFLSLCFYHIDLCVETETYHRCNAKNFHFTICGHCLSTMHTHSTHVWLHFIVFIHRKYIWMQKWRSGLQQIKLAKNTIVLANIPPGCMNIFFSLRQCDCYLSLHCTALS